MSHTLTTPQKKALKILFRTRETRSFEVTNADQFSVRTAKALEAKGYIDARVSQSGLSYNKRWVLTEMGLARGEDLCIGAHCYYGGPKRL